MVWLHYIYRVTETLIERDAMDRRTLILARVGGYTAMRQYQNGLGYWETTSTTRCASFPFHLLQHYSHRVHIRAI